MSSIKKFVRDIIINDRDIIYDSLDFDNDSKWKSKDEFNKQLRQKDKRPIIADFTEYSPLHNGHLHCMTVAKSKVPNGIFVAVVPGPFERSGRGLPYIMTRQSRAEIAISLGADIVVEGPPMGIMGSGQYSLCLAKMFQAVGADFIPRGYKPIEGFQTIMDRISIGHGVAPKPYKIVDMDTKEILMNGKLEEDNYVITSLSKSLKKIGFDFNGKFLFVPRIEGVSGTLIRQAVLENDLSSVSNMLPEKTINVLEREIKNNRAPLHDIRDEESILNSVNNLSFEKLSSLNLIDDKTALNIVNERENNEFNNINQLSSFISIGFTSHFQHRVLSSIEANINNDVISNFIELYPSFINVLKYKNKDVLEEFKNNIPHRRVNLCQ